MKGSRALKCTAPISRKARAVRRAISSFGGKVAGFFVQALGGEWAKTLHKWVDTSFRRKDYWHMFLYGAGVWVILACGLSLIRQMFRVHVMAGLVTMLALLGSMGLFMYVSWHFSR